MFLLLRKRDAFQKNMFLSCESKIISMYFLNDKTKGMILVFFPPQILLVSDYFYAFLRREHHLSYGLYLKKKDGSEATLVLK